MAYLRIETISGRGSDEAFAELEPEIVRFKNEYKDSSYSGRVEYLLGIAYVKNKKIEEGKKIFNDLIGNEGVSSYIKDLARSELSLINIKEKTL